MKKILSFVLAIVLCLSLSPTTFAMYAHEEHGSGEHGSEEIDVDSLLPCLISVASDAEVWGIEDIGSLAVGLPIHVYEYLNTGVLSEMDFVYYPVFSSEDLLFLIVKKDDGLVHATQGLVDTLSEYVGSNIAIVYDQDGTYIVTDSGESIVAYEYETIIDNRGDIVDISQIKYNSTINWTPLSQHQFFPPLESVAQPYYDPNMPPVSIKVPTVRQSNSDLCWAACVASVGEYFTGISYTDREIALLSIDIVPDKYDDGPYNRGLSIPDSMTVLKGVFNVHYPNAFNDVAPGYYELYSNISSGYPLFGRWTGIGYSHTTVIYSINAGAGYIHFMDPDNLVSSAKKGVSGFECVLPTTGTTVYLTGYGSKL